MVRNSVRRIYKDAAQAQESSGAGRMPGPGGGGTGVGWGIGGVAEMRIVTIR